MPELDDIELLAQYARDNSEAAFATLVTRHVNLVYSTALRNAGNPHAAAEITQAVFLILARKARSLSRRTILSGWLYQTARLTAANFLRAEIRRQYREQEAYMQSLLNEPEPEIWPQIAPLLDAAMTGLGEKDRNAVVLRFFENKSLGEVGLALGASENAREPRAGEAAEIFHETRCRAFGGGDCGSGFDEFRSRCARWFGHHRDCDRRERVGSRSLNTDPGKRSIENYGMDKNENCRRYRCGHTADRRHWRRRGQNHSCGAGGKCAGHSGRLGG
jgi:RNA polymerase sigma factor (sigma-70 family)